MAKSKKETTPDAAPQPTRSPESFGGQTITKPISVDPVAGPESDRVPCLVVIKGKQIGRRVRLTGQQTRVGRADDAELTIRDSSISRYHALFSVDKSGGWRIRDLGSTNGTLLNGRRIEESSLRDRDSIQLGEGTVIRFELQDKVDGEFFEKLYEAGTHDPMLGIFNRAYLEQHLDADFRLARRHGEPLSVLMIDIDHFKQVNDQHGHQAGDNVLRVISSTAIGRLRGEDILARYGGEEFVVILRHTATAGATALAESLRLLVERISTKYRDAAISVTISIGVATFAPPTLYDSPQSLLAAADKALYRAKQNGRNFVEVAQPGD
ncbi:MAG: diguanylate cyclase [Deltaproteobacteria bacterium]|nr:diguanylate cyclase [Deltaproteobacteria bacterium]